MKCPYCEAGNPDGEEFCNHCGGFLNPIAASVPPARSSMASSDAPLPGPGSRLQSDRYIIKKILGQGGMGGVLLATDSHLANKTVVVKELISNHTDPAKVQEDIRNFKLEVEVLARIDHPLVPNVTDHFQEGTHYFMVEEYVEGENLEEHLDRINSPMAERDALIYASEVLDILDYLGKQKSLIVHRDIKPANIIIGARDKRAHLVDFGIARAYTADDTRHKHKRTSASAGHNAQHKQTSALGTPGYAPPEQYQRKADVRSDLYALAATLHHLLTNRDPRNYSPFIYPLVCTLNSRLSPEVERILERALMQDPQQRYRSAAAMKRDVDDILLKRFAVSGDISSYMLEQQSLQRKNYLQKVLPPLPPQPPFKKLFAWLGSLSLIIIVLTFVVVGLLSFRNTSAGDSTKGELENIATQYYQAIQQQNYGIAYTYLASDAIIHGHQLTQESFTQLATTADVQKGAIRSFTISGFSLDTSNLATITVKVKRTGQSYDVHLELTQGGNDWKITSADDF